MIRIPGFNLTTSILTAAILVAAVGGALTIRAFTPADAAGSEAPFTVLEGWGGSRIASELADAGLVRWPMAVVIAARLTDSADSLQAGTYLLSPAMTPFEIVRILASGDALSDDIEVTIPEGMNVWEIDTLLQQRGLIVPGSFARTWAQHEGTLFPDTYRFDRAIASAASEFANAKIIGQVLRDAFDRRTSRHTTEQVIIASMLEKEAKSADDMALVAGIIARRRELGMPLQLDATVAYGWCLRRWLPMSSTANCDVTQAPIASEIKIDGPYNTYTRAGLPEGAIANPGLKALEAAANPKASDYLYYLSTRDGSQIIYSKTLQEHLQNRSKYLGF